MPVPLIITTAFKTLATGEAVERLVSGVPLTELRPLSGHGASGLVLFELAPCQGGGLDEADLEAIGILEATEGVDEVFVLGRGAGESALMQLMRSGVRQYFPLPLEGGSGAELRQAVERAAQARTRSQTRGAAGGRVINVFGGKGGVGATTVAVNLAAEINRMQAEAGEEGGQSGAVALIEMNPAFSDVSLFLDMEPLYHWGEAVGNVDRLDATFLKSIVSRHPSGLYVLPSPSLLDESVEARPHAVAKLFGLLREVYAYTVVDSGCLMDDLSTHVMELADRSHVVSSLSLPCLANLKKILERVERDEDLDPAALRVVFNRFLSNAEISVDEAEDILGTKAYRLLPNDYASTLSAINQGAPLFAAAPKAAVTKAVRKLAADAVADIADTRAEAAEAKTRSWLGGLFRREAVA